MGFYNISARNNDQTKYVKKETPSRFGNINYALIPHSSKNFPGLGNSNLEVEGTEWILPKGVQLVERPNKAFNPDLNILYGASNSWYVDLNFINNTDSKISINVPAGLTFSVIPSQVYYPEDVQSGILLKSSTITIPPSITDTTTIYVGVACLNKEKTPGRLFTSFKNRKIAPITIGMFKVSKIINDPNLRKIIDLVEDYDGLRINHHFAPDKFYSDDPMPEEQRVYQKLQAAIWSVTDGDGMNFEDYIDLLKALESYK